MSAIKIPTIFSAIDKISAPMRKMSSSISGFAKKSEASLNRMDRRVRKLTPSFRGLKNAAGGFGLFIGGAALIGGIKNVINTFAEFEQANANLSSVLSSATSKELQSLQADAIRLGSITAKTATEVVGLQESYARLGFAPAQIEAMTEATISGSIAMNAELSDAADLVGAVVKTFDNLAATDATQIMDQMVLSTQKSALSFEKLQTALPIVSGASNAAGISFTRTQALLGKLSDAGIDASSSATALRNIFLDSAKKGHSYTEILANIEKNQSKLTAANDEFGKRGAISAVILAKQLKGVDELDKTLQKAAKGQELSGAAAIAAAKQLDTLNGATTLLGSAYEGFILSLENGKGGFSTFLKTTIKVAAEILALLSGTLRVKGAFSKYDKQIRKTAFSVVFFGKVLGTIIGLYVAANVALKIWRIGLIAFNIVQGITAALTTGSAIALRGSTIALNAYGVAMRIVTAAQWLFNASNPVGWIILLIAAVALVVSYWDSWGASVTLIAGIFAAFFAPVLAGLALVVSLVQSFRRNWSAISEAFANGNIVDGFLLIGATILDAVLMPLQQVFELMAKIPGVGSFAQAGADQIEKFRAELGLNTEGNNETAQVVNSPAATEESRISREEKTTNNNANLLIKNESSNDLDFSGSLGFGVNLSSTNGF
jgi:TP901 family phage tail tape measure protein